MKPAQEIVRQWKKAEWANAINMGVESTKTDLSMYHLGMSMDHKYLCQHAMAFFQK